MKTGQHHRAASAAQQQHQQQQCSLLRRRPAAASARSSSTTIAGSAARGPQQLGMQLSPPVLLCSSFSSSSSTSISRETSVNMSRAASTPTFMHRISPRQRSSSTAITTTTTCAAPGSSGAASSSTTTTEGRAPGSSSGSSVASSSGASAGTPGTPSLSRVHHSSDKSVAASATAVSASLWSHDDGDEDEEERRPTSSSRAGGIKGGGKGGSGAATAAATTTTAAAAAAAARVVDAMQQQIDAWASSATTSTSTPSAPSKQQHDKKSAAAASPAATATAAVATGEEGLGWRRRWTMVLLCFFAFILCNMDRVNMAVAILPMSAQYGWQPATQGMIQSAFFWGYLCTQILGGVWAAKFGGKVVLGLGVLWWSVATALTPFAAQAGLPVLMAARALMGIGEGVAMPAMNQLLSKWVPNTERSRSLSLVYSGMFLGSMIGLTMSPQVINSFGWPSVFVSFGSLGIVWLLAWTTLAAASPSKDAKCSPAERAFIAAHSGGAMDLHGGAASASSSASSAVAVADRVEPAAAVAADRPSNAAAAADDGVVQDIPWRLLLSRKEVWAIILSHFCHNWGTFILLTWMPTYYTQELGLDLASSGTLSCLPWATMAISANVGGWLADWAISKGATITTVRKVMQTIGFLGPAFFLGQLSHVDGALGAVVCMMGAQGCDAFSQSGLYSNHQDIAPRYAGVLLGMSNTAGVLAGVLGSLVTGFILQHGTWDQVWQVAISLYLVGTVIWNAWATGERVFD